jgi:hypothetical protein
MDTYTQNGQSESRLISGAKIGQIKIAPVINQNPLAATRSEWP